MRTQAVKEFLYTGGQPDDHLDKVGLLVSFFPLKVGDY